MIIRSFHLAVLGVLLFIPQASHAQVMFSEIAWMGTDADANNEWIELYNMGGPTDLSGWTISDGDAFTITLSGTINGPHGIGVLERTDDNTLPGTAFMIYTGALTNSGATLTLKDASSNVVDQAVGGTDWTGIGGSNVVPKMTPQRTRTGGWVTNTPTPGADNAQENATIPSDTNTDTTSDTTSQTTSSSNASRSSSNSSGGSSAKAKAPADDVPDVLTLTLGAPKVAYVNQPIDLEVTPRGIGSTLMNSLSYAWNFGDTNTGAGKKVAHAFAYPGEYVVVVEAVFAKHTALARQEITVLPNEIEISRSPSGDILLRNKGKQEIDLAGYTIKGEMAFVFPKFSFLKAGATLTIPQQRVGAGKVGFAVHDAQGEIIAHDKQQSFTSLASHMSVHTNLPAVRAPQVTPTQKVPPQQEIKEVLQEGGTVKETPSAPQEQVIQIGTQEAQLEAPGFFSRVISKISSWF